MDLTDNIIEACNNTFPIFGFEIEFKEENQVEKLKSSEEVNLLIGLSNGLQGNLVISFSQETALSIISVMMGGMEVSSIDDMGKSALGEMANMIAGSAITGISSEKVIDLSPPTIAIAKYMYIMISNIQSTSLEFQLADKPLYLAYAIE